MQVPDLPWIEKYRPKSLKEVIGQKLIVERLKSFVDRGNFPSMIFAGGAGIGKTTCAIAMAKDLYSNEIDSAFKELNASDARGIDVIRGEVKEFAPGYYAVSFMDPDGTIWEFLHLPKGKGYG